MTVEPELTALQRGLRLHTVDGTLRLDRAIRIRRLVTATVRGLAGIALRNHAPDVCDRWFKPGSAGNIPPAYVFQPVHDHADLSSEIPFRIYTWDPPNELMPAMADALSTAEGMPFGEGGAVLGSVAWGSPGRLAFEGLKPVSSRLSIRLSTPLQLRSRDQLVSTSSFSLAILVWAMVARINLLSKHYGNGIQLHQHAWAHAAGSSVEVSRNLTWLEDARRSSSQETSISLSGLVGSATYTAAADPLANLLCMGEAIHVGRHTAAGCGCIRIKA